jgi:hypothetical protein
MDTNQHDSLSLSSISDMLSSIQLNPNKVLDISLINSQKWCTSNYMKSSYHSIIWNKLENISHMTASIIIVPSDHA